MDFFPKKKKNKNKMKNKKKFCCAITILYLQFVLSVYIKQQNLLL